MGSRPRLSAAAASRLHWNPRTDARGDCLFKSSAPERVGVAGRAALRGLAPGDDLSNSRRPIVVSAFRVCRDLFAGFRIPFPFQTCPAYACGYTLPPGVTCCRRLRGSGVELLGSMGSRPRLSAAAASRLHWNPRTDARGDCLFKSSAPERVGVAGRAALRGLAPGDDLSNSRRPIVVSAFRVCRDLFAGFRIPFPFQICPAVAWRYPLSPPSRLGRGAARFHGLTPTAKCCRRFAAPLEPLG